jgi:hypothetical protein
VTYRGTDQPSRLRASRYQGKYRTTERRKREKLEATGHGEGIRGGDVRATAAGTSCVADFINEG